MRMRRTHLRTCGIGGRVAVCVIAAGLASSGPAAQQQPPQFRAGVDLVTLDVAVVDNRGRPVTDLTQADFEIQENGVPQTVATFLPVHVPPPPPTTAVWEQSVSSDVVVNDRDESRLIVLVIDDATLPFDQWMFQAAKTAARTFIEQLGPADRAAVVFTRDNRNAQDFTTDKSKLRAAVERTSMGFLGMGPGSNVLGSAKGPVAGSLTSDLYYYRSSVETLAQVAEYLAVVPLRRKAIVWLSIGAPMSTEVLAEVTLIGGGASPLDNAAQQALLRALRRALDRAQRANVAIFPISPAGLGGIGAYNRRNPRAQLPGGFNDFLLTVAENTGGRAVININDLRPGVAQVFAETGSYYLLGYVPAPKGRDGSYRRLTVKVRRPGVEVRARSGYFVTPPEAAPDEDMPLGLSAISGVLPSAGLPLRGVATGVVGPDGVAAAVVTLGMERAALPGTPNGPLTVTTHVFDPEGRPRGTYSQEAPVCESAGWCELSFGLPLASGRHALRVSVAHEASQQAGSVYLDVAIPDPGRRSVSLSGIVLDVVPSGVRATDASVRALVPVVPTTRRDVATTDRATAFFRIHQGGTRAMVPVVRTVTLVDAHDATVLTQSDTLPVSVFSAARTVDQHLALPIETLAPGRYLLTVRVQAVGASANTAETRQLVLTVAAGD